ncbi:MAG TPA: NAD(P)H-dependent oxidoreductase subunit E [Candidatus Krumholzibacteria bacterium]|nr:NAD(P)H-dependent oxidoreductase subunit E [Candidatus Krumholzibacteria bacterium]
MAETSALAAAVLTDAAVAELEELARRYPTREALLLPALWLVQRQHGWISAEAMQYVARLLGVSPVRVYGVVSFYHMFHDRPPGKYNIQVCQTLSCSLLGAEGLLSHLQRRFGIGHGESTEDGRFMVQRVECLGACEHAPVAQINDDFAFDLTPAKLDALLEELP